MKKLVQLSSLMICAVLSFNTMAAEKPLRIGTECTYPPFTYRDSAGNIEGFDVDIAREVSSRMGRTPEFVCNPFASSIPALQARKFDVLFTAISVTEERSKTVNFSIPYRSSIGRFAGASSLDIELFNADGTPNPKALEGKVIGLQRSSTYDRYVQENFPGVEVRRYDTAHNMNLDLKAGRVDLIVGSGVNLWSTLVEPDGENFKFIGPELDKPEYFGIGVAAAMRKNDVQLQEQVNAALESMYADGTFKTINLKYWSFTVLPSVWQ
ncbi:transporter substrate-binding domain-containing protein [Zophobihabitans entericus]|uniref:Transporter substrate-binding domain-containing protein n=1 Tax=Zophobihabitans entericus TaxID=1635327 RepID=A0A6G9I865_9GAMM|nr:transporter substrate-binding domain-containing protein [Zophobihabitans entericus]QIQ20403.1 transporter substrate-binding domain-containing protein [Zophobihabitans entericus]